MSEQVVDDALHQFTLNRAEGLAVGAAVGDLLGSTFEGFDLSQPIDDQELFKGYKDIEPDDPTNGWKRRVADSIWQVQVPSGITEYMGHLGSGFWEYGETTDDTAQWVAVAESIVAQQAFDPADAAQRLLSWYDHGYGRGLGGTSILAFRLMDPEVTDPPLTWNEAGITAMQNGTQYVRRKYDAQGFNFTPLPANGAVMRTSVLALPQTLREDYDKLVQAADDLAIITHGFDECRGTAKLLTELAARLVNGEELFPALAGVEGRHTEYYERSLASLKNLQHGGGTLETTGLALDALQRADTFRHCIELLVNATVEYSPNASDTDSVAAVGGALAGAHWGYDQIPMSWQYPIDPRDGEAKCLRPHSVQRLRVLAGQLIEL